MERQILALKVLFTPCRVNSSVNRAFSACNLGQDSLGRCPRLYLYRAVGAMHIYSCKGRCGVPKFPELTKTLVATIVTAVIISAIFIATIIVVACFVIICIVTTYLFIFIVRSVRFVIIAGCTFFTGVLFSSYLLFLCSERMSRFHRARHRENAERKADQETNESFHGGGQPEELEMECQPLIISRTST